jgi:hypothetical protein
MKHLHLTTDLISKIDEVEFLYTQDRMNAIRDFRNEPDCVKYIRRENLRAAMLPSSPNPFFNRIWLSGPVSTASLGEVLDLYTTSGANPDLEISPGALDEELARFLQAQGYAQTKFHPVFVKPVGELSASQSDSLQVVQVSTPRELSQFQDIYLQGWDIEATVIGFYIERWSKYADWKLYLACLGDQPIGCAVLYLKNSIAHLADAATPEKFRGKGAQTALLRARFKDAVACNADLIFSRADFGSTSQKNMEKTGSPNFVHKSILDEASLA